MQSLGQWPHPTPLSTQWEYWGAPHGTHIVVLLFGAKNIPKLARSIGESANELKKGFRPSEDSDEKTTSSETKPKSKAS